MDLISEGVALVTGAASGLGEGVSHAFAVEGIATLIMVDINKPGLERVATEVAARAKNPCFRAVQLVVDVGDEVSIKKLFATISKDYVRLDYAVNNAGVMSKSLFEEWDTNEFDRITNINSRGVFLCMREEAALMLKQEPSIPATSGRGRDRGIIVNVASGAGLIATPKNAAYVGAKHAVVGYTKALALDRARDGVRVNAVAPGLVWTAIQPDRAESSALIESIIPAGRTGEVSEIADSIMFLCSPRSSYMHGHTLVVDGGYTIM